MPPTNTNFASETNHAHALYRGRRISSSYQRGRAWVFTIEGLPALPELVHVPDLEKDVLRREAIHKLLSGYELQFPDSDLLSTYPQLWTIRDIARALKIPYSRRGQIGKDLKALHYHRRHHVSGLVRGGKVLPACDVYSSESFKRPFRHTLASIREQYRREEKDYLRVLQLMRSRG